MDKEIIATGYTEIEKRKFHHQKNPILIDDVDINKMVASNKVSFGTKSFKYFIGYKDNEKVKPLYIMLFKMNGYTKSFNETKWKFFLSKNNDLLEKYKIFDKDSNSIKKRFDSEPVHNEISKD